MRILVDVRHLTQPKQSGVGEYTTQLLRALFELDKENQYVLFTSGRNKFLCQELEKSIHERSEQIKHIHINIPNKILNLRIALLGHPTLNWFVNEPIDLLFLPNLNITALSDSIPTVVTVHDLSWKFFPSFYSKKMQLWHKAIRPEKLISQAKLIITPSNATKNDVCRVFGKQPETVNIIPHGFDPQFHPKMEARDHGVRSKLKLPKRFALFVGTIEPRKNLIALIEGMTEYREQSRDDLHLVIAGKWGWRSHNLKRRLWKKDVQSWVHQIGYIDSRDRGALYRSATVLTWPSLYEGFGLPVLEAMASGTPVITSQTSSIPEITHDAAVHVDPYNSSDIADALKGLVGSKPLQDQLIEKGLNKASNYSWKQSAEKTLEMFKKIA